MLRPTLEHLAAVYVSALLTRHVWPSCSTMFRFPVARKYILRIFSLFERFVRDLNNNKGNNVIK